MKRVSVQSMKVLSDTCAFLWLVTNDTGHLTETATGIFLNGDNEIFFSIVSAREISIKAGIDARMLWQTINH